jgi:hypothetical protein
VAIEGIEAAQDDVQTVTPEVGRVGDVPLVKGDGLLLGRADVHKLPLGDQLALALLEA